MRVHKYTHTIIFLTVLEIIEKTLKNLENMYALVKDIFKVKSLDEKFNAFQSIEKNAEVTTSKQVFFNIITKLLISYTW